MKTTCVGILLWALLLPALTTEELQDVPKRSRIKREVILADEIYVDDLDQAATDSLGEIVVKRVLHSPIARASYYTQPDSVSSGKVVYVFEDDKMKGDIPGEEEPRPAGNAVGGDSARTIKIQRSTKPNVFMIEGDNERTIYVVKENKSQKYTASRNVGRDEVTASRASNQARIKKRRSQPQRVLTMLCKKRGKSEECRLLDQRSRTSAVGSEQGASRRTVTSSSQTGKGSGETIYVIRSEGEEDASDEGQVEEAQDKDVTEQEEEEEEKTEEEETEGEDVSEEEKSESAEDDEQESEGSEGDSDDEDENEEQEEGQENEQGVNGGQNGTTYNNNIEFHCNCGYIGDRSQIGGHICQYPSNSSNVTGSATNNSSETGAAVDETPSIRCKKIVIVKKYSGEGGKKTIVFIKKDPSPKNVADDSSSDQEEEDSSGVDAENEENDSEVRETNVRGKSNTGLRRLTGPVLIVRKRTSVRPDLAEGEGASSGVQETGGRSACGLCDGSLSEGPRKVVYVSRKPDVGKRQVIYVRKSTAVKKQGLSPYEEVPEEEEEEEEEEAAEAEEEAEEEEEEENVEEDDEGNYDDDDYYDISQKPYKKLMYVQKGPQSGKKYKFRYVNKYGKKNPEDYYVQEGDFEDYPPVKKQKMIIIQRE